MSTIWLAALCGVGALSAAGAAVLLTGQRRPSVAFGGALAFVSVLLVLVCAGLTVMQQRPEPRGRDGGAERLLEEMIERELR